MGIYLIMGETTNWVMYRIEADSQYEAREKLNEIMDEHDINLDKLIQ